MSAVVIGAGTYGEVYLNYLQDAGVDVVGFLDDDPLKVGTTIQSVPVMGSSALIGTLKDSGISDVYCPIGSNRTRVSLSVRARGAGLTTPNFIHRSVVLDSGIPHDAGIFMLPGVIVMPCVTIESDVMLSMSVNVAHHTVLKRGVFLSTGVSIGASMEIGCNAYAGMSATFVTGKCRKVGANSMIGAGAIVLSDVEAFATVAGIPARPIRKASV